MQRQASAKKKRTGRNSSGAALYAAFELARVRKIKERPL